MCPIIKVEMSRRMDGEGKYIVTSLKTQWDPDRPVFKLMTNREDAEKKYHIYWQNMPVGWTIGNESHLNSSRYYYHSKYTVNPQLEVDL